MANRRKNRLLACRLSDREFIYFQKKMISAGYNNIREYILALCDNQKIVKVDTQIVAKQLNKIGVNVNQIAKKANSSNVVSKNDVNNLIKEYAKIWQLLNQLSKEVMTIIPNGSCNI